MKTKIIHLIYSLLILTFFTTIFYSCSKGDDSTVTPETVTPETLTLPVVKTNEVYNITWTAAEVSGTVVSNGNDALTHTGFCWATHENPTLSDSHTSYNGNELGDFRDNIQDLTEGTTYFVCAYATNSIGTGYGDTITFTTGMSCLTMVQRQPGYQVWAGDTPYFQEDNHYDYFYSIDKYDYSLIGSSTITQSFNTGDYIYYVIVANYFSCIDAVEFNDGSYLNNNTVTLYTGLSDVTNMFGAPDGIAGPLGDVNSCPPGTYNGYITDSGTISSRGGGLTVIVVDGCQ